MRRFEYKRHLKRRHLEKEFDRDGDETCQESDEVSKDGDKTRGIVVIESSTETSDDDERNFKCHFCNKTYQTLGHVRQHERKKHAVKPYSMKPSSRPLFVQRLFFAPQMNLNKKQLFPKVVPFLVFRLDEF